VRRANATVGRGARFPSEASTITVQMIRSDNGRRVGSWTARLPAAVAAGRWTCTVVGAGAGAAAPVGLAGAGVGLLGTAVGGGGEAAGAQA